MTVSGPTGSGKTWLIKDILQQKKIEPTPDRILFMYKRWQPLYNEMQETIPDIEFVKGIPSDLDHDKFFDASQTNVVILDDMMSSTATDPKISDLFSEGSHHRSLGVINLTQNLFPPGRSATTQRRNTQYMVIFKSPMSQDQIRTLGTFMFPGRLDEFLQLYNTATNKPHGYLIIDAKQDTPADERFKTDILGATFVMAPTGVPHDDAIYHCGYCDSVYDDRLDDHECGKTQGKDISDYRFLCPHCQVLFTTPSRLITHQCTIKAATPVKPRQFKMDQQNNKSHDCLECGALYNTPQAVMSHMRQCGDGLSSCDSETDSENDQSEDESVWTDLLQEAYDLNDGKYRTKVSKYIEEEVPDAEERALEEMRPVYKKSLQELFTKMFAFALAIKRSKHYTTFMGDVRHYLDEKDYSLSKAVKAAVRRNGAIFDDVIEEDEQTDGSESSMDEENGE